jgi:hypothetical protein
MALGRLAQLTLLNSTKTFFFSAPRHGPELHHLNNYFLITPSVIVCQPLATLYPPNDRRWPHILE